MHTIQNAKFICYSPLDMKFVWNVNIIQTLRIEFQYTTYVIVGFDFVNNNNN